MLTPPPPPHLAVEASQPWSTNTMHNNEKRGPNLHHQPRPVASRHLGKDQSCGSGRHLLQGTTMPQPHPHKHRSNSSRTQIKPAPPPSTPTPTPPEDTAARPDADEADRPLLARSSFLAELHSATLLRSRTCGATSRSHRCATQLHYRCRLPSRAGRTSRNHASHRRSPSTSTSPGMAYLRVKGARSGKDVSTRRL